MLVQYTTAAGISLSYYIDGVVTMDAINSLAMLYAQHHPMILPDSVFMHVEAYTDFSKMALATRILTSEEFQSGMSRLVVQTGCGSLVVHPLPWGWQGPKILVGTKADYDEYDIDKIFEKIVMKGFERV